MVHHSIAVVITSFLTNFVELRVCEVRRNRDRRSSQKAPSTTLDE